MRNRDLAIKHQLLLFLVRKSKPMKRELQIIVRCKAANKNREAI